LKKTEQGNRGYNIEVLMCVEQGVELSMCSQSQGWAGEMMQAKMRIDCFLEYECIKPEMTEGKRTSFQGFINIHANSNHSMTKSNTAGCLP